MPFNFRGMRLNKLSACFALKWEHSKTKHFFEKGLFYLYVSLHVAVCLWEHWCPGSLEGASEHLCLEVLALFSSLTWVV